MPTGDGYTTKTDTTIVTLVPIGIEMSAQMLTLAPQSALLMELVDLTGRIHTVSPLVRRPSNLVSLPKDLMPKMLVQETT